jgi:5-formyltetrahydrofolate cyclo-ligase
MERIGDLREDVWTRLLSERVASYPLPPHGHHPNFKGAGQAASLLIEHLLRTHRIASGQTVLCYPDYVLKPLRKGLLATGVNVVVPAQYGKAYRYLNSQQVSPSKASSISGAEVEGEKITVLPEVQLVAVAVVALSDEGQVLGKGYGFSVPAALPACPLVTLVHPLQLRIFSLAGPQLKVDVYATPEKVVELGASHAP